MFKQQDADMTDDARIPEPYGYVRDKGNGLVTFVVAKEYDVRFHGSGFIPLYAAPPEPQYGECICPKCGLRHGTSNTDGGF